MGPTIDSSRQTMYTCFAASLLVIQKLAHAAPVEKQSGGGLQLLQWNPHWQGWTDPNFASAAENYITNQGECGQDVTSIVYNNAKWEPHGDPQTGCLQPAPKDRAFVMQMFQSKSDSSQLVAVVGAHFPHADTGDFKSI